MVTLICSLGRVTGAEEAILFWLACAAGYAGLCLLFRVNRTKGGRRAVFIALAAAAVVFDLALYLCCFAHGQYVNRGIGTAWGFLLWAPALLLTGALVTVFNKARG